MSESFSQDKSSSSHHSTSKTKRGFRGGLRATPPSSTEQLHKDFGQPSTSETFSEIDIDFEFEIEKTCPPESFTEEPTYADFGGIAPPGSQKHNPNQAREPVVKK